MILSLLATTLALQHTPAKSFVDLEQKKYEAFTALRSFKGHYAIVTTKSDGTSMLQDIVYQFGPKGRQVLVLVNREPTLEYGWNETQIWRVVYPEKVYAVANVKDALDVPKFEVLPTKKGEFSYRVGETGVRFGMEPDPGLSGPQEDKLDQRVTRKFVSVQKVPEKNAELTVTQWLDESVDIVRQYEIKVLNDGKLQFLVKGVLLDDDTKAIVPPTVGELPLETLRAFRRIGS